MTAAGKAARVGDEENSAGQRVTGATMRVVIGEAIEEGAGTAPGADLLADQRRHPPPLIDRRGAG